MRRTRATRALTTALLLMLAPTLALAAHHEGAEEAGGDRKAWDQERMTELSAELFTATSELRRAFRREPNFRKPGTPNQRSVHNMEQILRNLEIATRRLRNSVAGGGDFGPIELGRGAAPQDEQTRRQAAEADSDPDPPAASESPIQPSSREGAEGYQNSEGDPDAGRDGDSTQDCLAPRALPWPVLALLFGHFRGPQ